MISSMKFAGVDVMTNDDPDEVVREIEKRSPPNSEIWHVVCDGPVIHTLTTQIVTVDGETGLCVRKGFGPVAAFKKMINGIESGCVAVMLPLDAKEKGAEEILAFIVEKSREKGFNVLPVSSKTDTKTAIDLMLEAIADDDAENHTAH
jgi:hypothetical protein